MLGAVDSRATPGTSSSPLTELLYGQVERVLARWQETDGDKSPAAGAVARFLAALAALQGHRDTLPRTPLTDARGPDRQRGPPKRWGSVAQLAEQWTLNP